MGLYVNPNEALLKMAVNSKIYVDKSMIFNELNQRLNTASQQIESKQYFNVLDKYQGDLLLVAVNYDEKTNEHTCEIKRYVK